MQERPKDYDQSSSEGNPNERPDNSRTCEICGKEEHACVNKIIIWSGTLPQYVRMSDNEMVQANHRLPKMRSL